MASEAAALVAVVERVVDGVGLSLADPVLFWGHQSRGVELRDPMLSRLSEVLAKRRYRHASSTGFEAKTSALGHWHTILISTRYSAIRLYC